MAQAPQYEPTTSFRDNELNNQGGRSTVSTELLDGELQDVAVSVNALQVNQELNQRDDGEIRDQRVKMHTLAADVLAFIAARYTTPRGAWVTATSYAIGDLVGYTDTNTYICVTAHTSGVFATDLAAGRWLLFTLGTTIGAGAVSFAPTGTIAATDVQAAINESDTEVRALVVAEAASRVAGDAASAAYTDALESDLASTASASVGTGLLGWLRAATGAVASTLYAWLDWQNVHVFEFMTMAQRIDVLSGANTLDVVGAWNAAHAAALAQNKAMIVANGLHRHTSQFNHDPRVPIIGGYQGWCNFTASTYAQGAAIYKAHNGHGISTVGTFSTVGTVAAGIKNISVFSDYGTWASGSGFYSDTTAELVHENCNAFACGGWGFELGVTATNQYNTHNHVINAYSNNCQSGGFKIGSKWSRLRDTRVDGGAVSYQFINAGDLDIMSTHAEGFTSIGYDFQGGTGRSVIYGKNFIGNTVAGGSRIGVRIQNVSGNGYITLENFEVRSTLATQTFTALQIVGSNAVNTTARDWEVVGATIGVDDSGDRTNLLGNYFYGCDLPIRANGNRYRYLNNRFEATVGANTINHVAGTIGLWQGNEFDKAPLPTLSGTQGNYSGIRVKDNPGFVTRARGTTAGGFTTGTNIAHGLAGTPNDVKFGSYTVGISGLAITTLNATNFAPNWTGGATQIYWEAACPCDY